ncbi:hypothetical protein FHW84_002159 [Dyella sp. SG562]|nr:hypothetical protein [Dyella sp. SG562]
MEQITSARYADFDERRRKREAIEADQADEAELKALEQRLNRRPKS